MQPSPDYASNRYNKTLEYMKKLITLFSILFVISSLSAATDTSKCNWKSRITRFDVYNNCDSHKTSVNIIGKISLSPLPNCNSNYRRVWKFSGNNTGGTVSGENLYFKVTQNGTYTVCMSLYDSCNNCDTVICKTVTVSCLGCNWKSKIGGFDVWNNCDSGKNSKNIIGKFHLNQKYTCSKKAVKKWTLNGNVIGTGDSIYHPVYNNGTYTVCMTLYDSCRNCDTVICKTTTINCFPGCNWKNKIHTFTAGTYCDSLKHTGYLTGKLTFNQNYNCSKTVYRKWMVNNTVAAYGENLLYTATQNGTYNICVLAYDSCNKCDTVLCKSVTLTCFRNCNWKSKITSLDVSVVCDTAKRAGYITGTLTFNKNFTCASKTMKRWSVNGNVLGYGEYVFFPASQNGSYSVCMTLYDSCNKCDTTICRTLTVTCNKPCTWKNRISIFNAGTMCDSLKRAGYLTGKLTMNQNYNCGKVIYRKWMVNNTVAGYGENLFYPVSQNGSYNICVVVYDSCSKCDTMLCRTVTVNCFKSCNWKSKVNDFHVNSSCDSGRTPVYINGSFILNKNYTCTKGKTWKWSINNSVVSTSLKLRHNVTQNGTYNVCLWLYDSCNNCDTSFCKTITVNCIKAKSCNWKSKVNDFHVNSSCDSGRTPVYINGSFILNKNYTCTKGKRWKWSINNSVVSTSLKLRHNVTQNGTYNVCLWLYDSCNNCDTSFCKTITVNCIKTKCAWKNNIGVFTATSMCDSLKGVAYITGKFTMNQNYKCNKPIYRKWMVNNTVAGYGENLFFQAYHKGSYKVCVVVYDSCNRCDTSLCTTVTVGCRYLSTDEMAVNAMVRMYPNPASDLVNIVIEQANDAELTVRILDLSGRMISESVLPTEGGTAQLDVRQLPPGVYLVRVVTDGQSYHLRLIKN
jgi:hypothetical protein